jgi:molybdopterin-guanine dinucleotide biosynthesis protein A
MAEPEQREPVIGIFVGGQGRRMGGVAKGNLSAPSGEKLAERLVARCAAALPSAPVVLVGRADDYTSLGLPALADAPPGIGPLGGLRALLLHAQGAGRTHALALSCDLPYLEAGLLVRLAREAPAAVFLAPREGELWSTLVARYAVAALAAVDAAIDAREHALQKVVRRLGASASELSVSHEERRELRDWDVPGDVSAH